MGDAIYYVTYFTFDDVNSWVKPTTEIHKSAKLSKWIQRQLIRGHADNIAKYLQEQKERFFSAIVVGIYGGEPKWAPFSVAAPVGDIASAITDAERERMEASVGVLQLSGDEKIFAIDGQHRVAGIKASLENKATELKDDEVVVLVVGHKKTAAGERRTRRLFTTLNKTARRVSDADRIALDEDDGFAVVTRRLVDEFDLLQGQMIAFAPTAALPTSDDKSLTTIINLNNQLRDMYFPAVTSLGIKKRDFGAARPTDEAMEEVYLLACDYWKALKQEVKEISEVLGQRGDAGMYRQPDKNHLLLRPVGQRAFAGATGVLMERGASVKEAVKRLATVDMWIHKKMWHHVLWDPVQEQMLKTPANAETLLLRKLREKGRTAKRDKNLDEALAR
jgi:DNA sulfur modification protein DndB